MKRITTLVVLLGLLLPAGLFAQFNQSNGSVNTCSGTFHDSGGSFGNYSNSEFSVFTICSNAGNCVSVNFTSFDLESGFDFLTIYDGPSTLSPVIGTYTGFTSPGNVTSSSGCLTFEFSSDFSVTSTGWDATISCAPCGGGSCLPNMGNCVDNTCSGNFFDSGGPAGSYGNNENLTHTICSNAGNCIEVNFSSFDIESGFDFLTIYDGPNTLSPVIGTYTGFTSPGLVTSTTGCLTFVFTSDGSVTNPGWAAFVQCNTCGGGSCLPNMGSGCNDNACSGNFFDTGGLAGNYANNEANIHTICSSAGNCVAVNFSNFNTESGFDVLTIYDGPNTLSPLIGSFTGLTGPGLITSSTGCLTFQFTSDGSVTTAGWESSISCVPCGGGGGGGCLPNHGSCLDSTCASTYYDPGGPAANYANNTNMIHTICSNNGSCLNINWNSFDTESGLDFINIYDGPTTASPSIGSYSGFTLPPSINTTSDCITIEFFSDGSVTGTGWDAVISCGTCATATTADCDSAIQVCSATTNFPITANGLGLFNEIPPSGSFGNPSINPASTNSGCLLSNELNSTWLVFNIQTAGLLEFHFGVGTFPQTGFYDWMMYDLTNSTCADIPANNVAPVRCNWNCSSSEGTGMASAANIPPLASACNYEPPMTVSVGDLFVICFTNWSNANGTVGFNFEVGAGNALVNCTPILEYEDILLLGEAGEGVNHLNWISMNNAETQRFYIERKLPAGDWETIDEMEKQEGMQYVYDDPMPNGGLAEYRVRQLTLDSQTRYSNTVSMNATAAQRVELFPVPAIGQLNVVFRDTETPGDQQIEILDAYGKTVATHLAPEALTLAGDPHRLDISDLPAGVYFLRTAAETLRFVKVN